MSQEQYLRGTADEAQLARRAAGREGQMASPPGAMRRGTVTATLGGYYTVDVMAGAGGGVAATINGVTAWGGNFEVGDFVWLVYEGDRPVPFIMGGGGSSGGSIAAMIIGQSPYFTQ
jgi:hypothetical protein